MENFNRILNMQDILNQNVNVFNLAWIGSGVEWSGDQLQYQNRRITVTHLPKGSIIIYSNVFSIYAEICK